MYNTFKTNTRSTRIQRRCDSIGESIETEIRQAIASKKPLEMTSEMIYTDIKEGVLPQYNVRTDKQELAIDLATKFEKSDAMKGELATSSEEETTKQDTTTQEKTE